MLPNYYTILGILPDATQEEIKKAFRLKAKLFHPDVSGNSRSGDKFVLLNEAYEVLMDEHKRFLYDLKFNYKPPLNNTDQDPRKYGTAAHYRKGFENREQTSRQNKSPFSAAKPQVPSYMVSFLYLFGMFIGFTIVMVTLRAVYLHYWPSICIFVCVPGLALIKEAWTGINGKGSWIKKVFLSLKRKFQTHRT